MLKLKNPTNLLFKISFNNKKNFNITHLQKFNFSKGISFLSSEISVYNQKIDETEILSVENFLEEFYEYKSTNDFKIEKEKIILPQRHQVDLPFTLYQSKGQPFYFLIWLFIFFQGIFYFMAYIRQNYFLKKFNPQFTRKYLYVQLISFGINLIFIKHHLKFVKKITIRNFDKNNLVKNLEIKLFSGKKILRNVNELNINKSEMRRVLDRNYLVMNSYDYKYHLSLKGAKVNDKSLFCNIIRGVEIKI